MTVPRPTVYGTHCARVLLVGEAPSRRMTEESHALMRRDLSTLAGTGYPTEYWTTFARCNLLRAWPGRGISGKGDAWDAPTAREAAQALAVELLKDDAQRAIPRFELVVLLGRRVEAAFQVDGRPWFRWGDEAGIGVPSATAPHPSRVSRWWNVDGNEGRARAFWSALPRPNQPCNAEGPDGGAEPLPCRFCLAPLRVGFTRHRWRLSKGGPLACTVCLRVRQADGSTDMESCAAPDPALRAERLIKLRMAGQG